MATKLTLEEKKRALGMVADHIIGDRLVIRFGPTSERFANWGEAASITFLRALHDLGYDLVRKDNE